MNETFTFPALEQMETPILICNEAGVVIYKNPSAMRAIRLPRRNTAIHSHLRQAEAGELERIGERKKPSILTLHTGDRPARAMVIPYVRDADCSPVLSSAGVAEGEVCSLWIFPAILQVYVTSPSAQYIESAAIDLAPELCKLVKDADRLSGLLPGKERREVQEKLNRRINRLLSAIERLPEGRWFDLRKAIEILIPIVTRRLELLGARLDYKEDSPLSSVGQAVDLPRMALQLLHLLIYCVTLSGSRTASLCLHPYEAGVQMSASFTLTWPPFTVQNSNDLQKLCLLLPGNQIDLLVLGSICKGIGKGLQWSLTEEAENNLTVTVDLPVIQRNLVRAATLSSTELLFLERDMEAIFGAVLEERLSRYIGTGDE